jgi:hypothetical protein
MGHGEGLAGTGDAQQNLVALAFAQTRGQVGDRLRLIARRLIVGMDPLGDARGGRQRSFGND